MRPVILAESVPLFRRGIRTTLEHTDEWTIFESTDCTEIIELAQVHHPACAILNGSLITMDPFELCWSLRQQSAAIGILILAQAPDEDQCFQFLRYGASAYELRSISPEMLVDRVRRVSNGEYLITGEALLLPQPRARAILALATGVHKKVGAGGLQTPTPAFPLSPRELEMLEHIARGSSNKEIAKSLKISDQTVKNHITSILKKLSVDDRTAAVVYALRHHWISLESAGAAGDSEVARTKTSSVAEGLAI